MKFLDHIDCLLIQLSSKYTIVDINQLALDAYGWQKNKVLRKNFLKLLKKEKFKNPIPRNFSFVTTKKSIKDVQTTIRKKQKKIIIKWMISPIIDKGFQGIMLSGYDVTEQRNLEDKVYELDSIVAQMPGNVYWYDKNFIYLGCNENSAKTLGMSREQAIGKNIRTIEKNVGGISEKSRNKWVLDDLEVMKSKIPKLNIEEPPFIGANKEMVYMISNKVPLFDKKGRLYGLLGISTDITNRKRMEEDLRKAKEQAEAANKAKTDFLANMSHDVKTPLSGIIAISELLKFRVSKEYQDLALDIMESGRNLMTFFENCIELSKLESSSEALSEENFSLKELLNEILRLYQPAIKSKGLIMRVDYSKEMPIRFYGNRIYLYRILLNLMGNAIKFTSQGSISIDAELTQESTSKIAIIKLIIKDTGIGIPKDKQDIIFEQFSRVTPSYEGVYEGSGIGLYIVQKFVKEMGGKIYVESDEGKGSQFTIVIPLKIKPSTNGERKKENEINFPQDDLKQVDLNSRNRTYSTQDPKSPYVSLCNILLVEDNLIAQKSARLLLQSLGCNVDVADCGERAIALFQPGKYNLILLDIGLPDMKGYLVAKSLREKEEETSFHAPILGLSAHVTKEEKQLGARASMDGIFSKPLLFNQAVSIIKQYTTCLFST